MDKTAFLTQLTEALSFMDPAERVRTVQYYREILEDRIEEGMREEDAVAGMEPVAQIAARLRTENAPASEKKRSRWPAVLLIAGSPVWLPVLLAVGAVLFSLFVTAAVLMLCLLIGAGCLCLMLTGGYPLTGVFLLGAGMVCAAVGLTLFLLVLRLWGLFVRLIRWPFRSIQKTFARKRGDGMKRGTKRCLFAAAVLAVLGVALCTAALAKVNFDITRLSVPSDEEREARDFSFDPAEVERIVIQTGLDNVKLLPSADGQIHLRCFSGGGMVYDAAAASGELAVRQRQEGTRKLPPWFQFDLIGGNHGKELSLSIPKGFDGDLVLELDAGAVEITDGVEIAGAVDAILSLGGFSAENLSARSLTVKCSAGDVSGREWKIGQYAFLTASLGRISLEDSAVGSTLSCSADLGDISISDVSAQETLFHAGAGRIEFSRLAAEQIQADADLGDIKGSVLGEETEYSIDAGADLGSCDLTNRWGTGDKTLRVSCGAGDIRVRFLPGP